MSWRHRDILEAELHEPKGFTTANNGDSIWRNENGASEWTDREVLPAALNFVDASVAPQTTATGDIYVLSLGASIHANWGTVALKDWVRYNGTSWQVITPSKSILCYDKTLDVLMSYDGSAWNALGGGDSIYTANGTLTGNRDIDSDGNTLLISNGSKSVGVDSWNVHTYWSLNNGSNAWTLLSANASGTFNQNEFGISFNGSSTVPFRIFGGDKIALGNVSKSNLDTNYSVNVKNGLIIQDGNFKHESGVFTIETKANQEIRTFNNGYPSFYFDNNTTNYQVGNADASSGTFDEGDFFIYNSSTVKTNLLITKTGQTIISNGATSVIGNEKISLQDDTLIKGSDTSESSRGFCVTDVSNDMLFDVRNNGQIGYGGDYNFLYAHKFRNPNNEARIASFDDDTAGTESFIIQTNGRFYSEQFGQAVFSSYRQSGQSFAKVYDAGVESIRLGKQGSFINGALRVGGPSGSTTGTTGARFEIQQQSTNTYQQLFFANARMTTTGRVNSSGYFGATQAGLECYDTTLNKKFIWNGSAWEQITSV